ncbi:MAG: hypothetical protein ACPGUY_09135, partial [Akkermansiaceae bacterium]
MNFQRIRFTYCALPLGGVVVATWMLCLTVAALFQNPTPNDDEEDVRSNRRHSSAAASSEDVDDVSAKRKAQAAQGESSKSPAKQGSGRGKSPTADKKSTLAKKKKPS